MKTCLPSRVRKEALAPHEASMTGKTRNVGVMEHQEQSVHYLQESSYSCGVLILMMKHILPR